MTAPTLSTRNYLLVFLVLIALTVLTTFASFFELGRWHIVVAMLIAFVKATLVAMFFMHLLFSKRLLALAFVASLLWLLILFGLTFADYVSRGWL